MTLNQIDRLKLKAIKSLETVETATDAESWLSKHTGRKSELTTMLRQVKDLPADKRAEFGQTANAVRVEIESQGQRLLQSLNRKELDQRLSTEHLDLTVPGQPPATNGGLHPITQERLRVEEIFQQMGFAVHDPYLIDSDYNNFTAVNIPEGHPARDMWDTMRIDQDLSLIVHTSSMQNRIISGSEPPIRAIVPGKNISP